MALSTDDRQAEDSNRVAAKRVPIVLALEEQGREVWPTLREPGNTRANPTDEQANPLWGAPRIHGELLKLGIQISKATVAKYMVS